MKRSVPKTRWNLIIILIIFGAISYAGYKYFMPKPQSAGIFLVSETPVSYGNTTVTGALSKDTSAGKAGTFIVVLPDSSLVLLDVQGLDSMLGLTVTVSGNLTPSMLKDDPMFMIVKSITAK